MSEERKVYRGERLAIVMRYVRSGQEISKWDAELLVSEIDRLVAKNIRLLSEVQMREEDLLNATMSARTNHPHKGGPPMYHPPLSQNESAFKEKAKAPSTTTDVYMAEAMWQDAELRRRQVAGMAEGQTREALLTLLGVLADQMPPMTAEAGYWYALGFLEATVGTYKGADKEGA